MQAAAAPSAPTMILLALYCRYGIPFPGDTYLDMKRKLHVGGVADLNLYIMPLNAGGTIGCAPLPVDSPTLFPSQALPGTFLRRHVLLERPCRDITAGFL